MTDQTIAGGMGPPPLPADEWYYVEGGARKGPVSVSVIKDMIANGQLEPDDQVWCKGMKEWQSIRDSHLSELVAAEPPPISGEHINNTLVWILAVLPLAFGIGDAWVAAQGGVRTALPWQIPIAINTLFALWDEHWLKKAGYSDKWMKAFAVLLIPVYLFVRAKRLKQRPWYGFAWIGALVLSLAM